MSHHGNHNELADLRRRFSVSLKGLTMAQLMRHASAMSLTTRPLRVDLDEIKKLALPCILHWNLNHFVVLKKIETGWNGHISLLLLDPAIGERRVNLEETSKYFTGVALEISPSPEFQLADKRRRSDRGSDWSYCRLEALRSK
ncbi:cysteine peptidase family C39 domain-containing protein [Massilia sp. H-1]|nr:cysteine peptidase family C39 domain-containing protein [Massilia sp. H-1]